MQESEIYLLQIMLIWDYSFPIWKVANLNGSSGMEKMLLCVTWLVPGQDGIPFRINCEDELDSFLGSREGWDGCNKGFRNACQ